MSICKILRIIAVELSFSKFKNGDKIVKLIPAKHRLTVYALFPLYLEDTCCCRGDNPTRELSYTLWF